MSVTECPYKDLAIKQIPRLLSRMDREAPSKTYGSFDRTFWAWKFTDFPGSRFQEGIYALSWAYINDTEYTNNDVVLEWIIAGFAYWRNIQYSDGSFDEAYPYERSLEATAFTAFYLGEAFILLGDKYPETEKLLTITTLKRAGDWLLKNDEHHGILSNHLAVAAAALYVIFLITNNQVYRERSDYFLNKILSKQSKEGWYEEYGGADFGYQTHGVFYLARLWQHSNNEKLLDSLKESIKFLSYFIHPNGTLGGEYGSRNTNFYFPAGIEILADECPEAAAIAAFMRDSIYSQKVAGLDMMDAYNFCPMLNNYLFAHMAKKEFLELPKLPFETEGQWFFKDAGLIVHNTSAYQAVFAISKGGVLKIYDNSTNQLSLSDCGYWCQLNNTSRISNQSFSLNNNFDVIDNKVNVEAQFVKINQKVMNPWLFICFRLFTLIVGRNKSLAIKMKSLLVKVLVSRRSTVDMKLNRSVEFLSDQVKIIDCISGGLLTEIGDNLRQDNKFSTIHMGSSRYFQKEEIMLDNTVEQSNTPKERTYIWSQQ